MNKLYFLMCFVLVMTINTRQANAQLLKEPAAWAFERFELPPSFAPDFPYNGAEELRFSPGMFNKDSASYFSYAFVAQLDNTTSISLDDIRNYLLTYFKGLCNVTAKDRKLTIDTSKISVSIERKNTTERDEIIYNGLLDVFGVFADGAPVKLNMEIKVLLDNKANKAFLIFITSPRPKTDGIWKELYKIQRDFVVPD